MIKPLVHSLFASLVMASIGCGNGLSSLTGTVRVDGQPAPEGVSLEFSPTAAGGAPSYGSTDSQGRYEAAFTFREKGIQPGASRSISSRRAGPGGPSKMPEFGPDGKPIVVASVTPKKFPDAYFQEIQKIQVESGSNKIDIDLVTEEAK